MDYPEAQARMESVNFDYERAISGHFATSPPEPSRTTSSPVHIPSDDDDSDDDMDVDGDYHPSAAPQPSLPIRGTAVQPQPVSHPLPSVMASMSAQFAAGSRGAIPNPWGGVPMQTDPFATHDSLGAVFQAPVDLIFAGSFESAKEHAMNCQQWLLVNLQDIQCFESHNINRDTWSDPDVKALVTDNFVFIQPKVDTPPGAQYKSSYPTPQLPSIDIVDPITGVRVFHMDGFVGPMPMRAALRKFVKENEFGVISSEAVREIEKLSQNHDAPKQSSPGGRRYDDEDESLQRVLAQSLEDHQRVQPSEGQKRGRGATQQGPSAAAGQRATASRPLRNQAARAKQASALGAPVSDASIANMELKSEQERDYEESLRLDQEKQRQEDERMMKEALKESEEQLEAERRQRKEEQAASRKEQRLKMLQQSVVDEPEAGEGVVSLAFRLPDSSRITRRFSCSATMQSMFDWLELKGMPPQEYVVSTAFPKKDLAPSAKSLADEGLGTTQMLTVMNNPSSPSR